jgi:hypothetical protein
MGLFAKRGVPKIVLRALEPALAPGETLRQYVMLQAPAASSADVRERAWVLAATDRQVFLYPARQTKSAAPQASGTPLGRVRMSIDGDGGTVHISRGTGPAEVFTVLAPWRGKLAELLAVIESAAR